MKAIIKNKTINFWVFDNAGTKDETFDRFTIILPDGELLASSERPFAPNGFGQHTGNLVDNRKRITFGSQWRKGLSKKLIAKITKEEIRIFLDEARNDVNWIGKEVTDKMSLPTDVYLFISQNFPIL